MREAVELWTEGARVTLKASGRGPHEGSLRHRRFRARVLGSVVMQGIARLGNVTGTGEDYGIHSS